MGTLQKGLHLLPAGVVRAAGTRNAAVGLAVLRQPSLALQQPWSESIGSGESTRKWNVSGLVSRTTKATPLRCGCTWAWARPLRDRFT
jgi:hypothetical protein